ncbi:unnamed protein product, partial [marine sediment metagenome]
MRYTYKHLPHLRSADFWVDSTSSDIERGHCMWGGSAMPSHEWCGVKVHNKQASGRVQRAA